MNCFICGVTAVGTCTQCHRGLCKEHGDYDGSNFYCKAHNYFTRTKEMKKMMEEGEK